MSPGKSTRSVAGCSLLITGAPRRASLLFLCDAGSERCTAPGTSSQQRSNQQRSNQQRSNLARVFALLVIFALTGCRQKMANQPRYDPLEASDFFQDGMAARPRLPGTIARGELPTDEANAPMAVTLDLVNRGQQRYNIYCTPCHGRTGDGNGMIPARGYRRPPSFHTLLMRDRKDAHYFDVMTNGFGSMPSYRTMIPPRDRWAIVAYVRALQLSQSATAADVPPAERARLDAGGKPGIHGHSSNPAPQGGAH